MGTFSEDIHWPRFRGFLVAAVAGILGGSALGIFGQTWWLQIIGGILAAMGIALSFLSLNLRVLRVRLAGQELRFSLGLFSVRLPVAQITVMGTRRWRHEQKLRSFGWGVRPVIEGEDTYMAWGGAGDAFAVVATDDSGRTIRYLVTTTRPKELLESVMQSQSAASGAPGTPDVLNVLNS